MRFPHLASFALAAAVLATTGCGRVAATQVGTSTTAATVKSGSTKNTGKGAAPSVNMMATGIGQARGRVVEQGTNRPLAGIVVTAQPGGQRFTTDATGTFTAAGLQGGNYTFKAAVSGMTQAMPSGALVMPNEATDIPEIQMLAGGTGAAAGSGITSITYVLDKEMGRAGVAPAPLVNPIGIAVRGNEVMTLDINGSMLVHTGIIRTYDAETGAFDGKYGDYSKWLGFSQMKDTVKAITLDNQGRAVVLDGAQKLWRFSADGAKEKGDAIETDGVDITTDRLGNLIIAGPSGLTKLNAEGGNPQPLGELGDCRAVAGGKDALWAIVGGKVAQITTDGKAAMEFGASGADGTATFSDAVDLAVDPRNGHVVVVDKGAQQVYVYDTAGTLIGKIGQGMFESPVAVTVDAAGKVYVVDQAKKKIYAFLPGVIR